MIEWSWRPRFFVTHLREHQVFASKSEPKSRLLPSPVVKSLYLPKNKPTQNPVHPFRFTPRAIITAHLRLIHRARDPADARANPIAGLMRTYPGFRRLRRREKPAAQSAPYSRNNTSYPVRNVAPPGQRVFKTLIARPASRNSAGKIPVSTPISAVFHDGSTPHTARNQVMNAGGQSGRQRTASLHPRTEAGPSMPKIAAAAESKGNPPGRVMSSQMQIQFAMSRRALFKNSSRPCPQHLFHLSDHPQIGHPSPQILRMNAWKKPAVTCACCAPSTVASTG